MCPKQNHQSRTRPENLDMRSVETTRPLRGVRCTGSCSSSGSQCESWNNHSWHLPNSLEMSFGILSDLVYMATRARCPLHQDPDRFRGCNFRGTVFGARNAPPERRECLARTGSPTSGDRGQVEIQSFCHESRSRVDQLIHDSRTNSTSSDSERRIVAQRRVFPFAESCHTVTGSKF